MTKQDDERTPLKQDLPMSINSTLDSTKSETMQTSQPTPQPTPKNKRLMCLDLLRGATIVLMTIVNFQFGRSYWWVRHVPWNGVTPADFVFPFFLWIMGYAVGISFRRVWAQKGSSGYGKFFGFKIKEPHARRLNLAYKIIKRTILLFLIGFLLNLFGNRFQKVRVLGVLQRISLCYFIVTVIYVSVPSVMVGTIIMFALQLVYLAIMLSLDVPGCGRGVITPECNASGYIDRLILGSSLIYRGGPYDPEGIVSTLTAALTTWMGLLHYKLAEYVKTQSKSEQWPEGKYENRVALYFVFSGISLIIVSLIIHIGFPLNKPIWSPSYAIFMPGCAALCLAILMIIVDILKWNKYWVLPFIWVGSNPLLLYVIPGIVVHLMNLVVVDGTRLMYFIFKMTAAAWAGDNQELGSLLFSIAYELPFIALAGVLYWNKIFVKL